MKPVIFFICIVLIIISCSETGKERNENKQKTCEHHVPFGNTDICLPVVDGMTECYSNPKAKSKIDPFVDKEALQLALYLNN
jgi:hypothetical protein